MYKDKIYLEGLSHEIGMSYKWHEWIEHIIQYPLQTAQEDNHNLLAKDQTVLATF
jgi:hypothetical protein